MKELGYTLTDIHKGLRPYDDTTLNQGTLVQCLNLVPRPNGLIKCPDITTPITAVSVSHPFPQIFIGHKHWVCCTETKIYTINSDYSLTQQLDLSVYYGTYPNAPKGTWHFADFFDYVVLTNGGITAVYNPDTSIWEYNDGTTIPTLGTVLNFNGQIVGSGVETVAGDAKTEFNSTTSNFAMWGGIGVADFTIDQSNTRGNMPMPWYGEIYKAMQLGQYIVFYGAGGIAVCKFELVSLGIIKTFEYGIASREAVGGDKREHVFIDSQGNLRKLTAELEEPEPSFNEFFSTMLGREVVVSFNRLQREWYISDGVRSFLFTRTGLGEVFQALTTLDILAGNLIGFYTDLGDNYVRLTTDGYDFGSRGNKTIDTIEVSATTTADMEVAVDYKFENTDSWASTGWVTVNKQGVVNIPIAGIDFRFKLRVSSKTNFKLSYIIVRLKADDRRSIRGISNADKTTTRTGQ